MKFGQMSALMRDANEVGQMNVLTLTILAGCPSLIPKDGVGSKTVWLRECLAQRTQIKLMDTVMEYEIIK